MTDLGRAYGAGYALSVNTGAGVTATYRCLVTVIDTEVYADGVRVAHGEAPEGAIRDAHERHGAVWIGLQRPGPEELEAVGRELGLHPLAVSDCLRGHQRAKLEHFGDTTFLVLQPARYLDDSETVTFSEVDVFVGSDFIVTVHDEDPIGVELLRKRLDEHPEVLAKGTYGILWAILEYVLDGYSPVLDGVENDIDEIEQQLFSREPGVSQRIFKLQREVIDLQHATGPLTEMLDRMQRIVADSQGTADAPAFRDADDRAQHVDARVHGFRHTLDNALTVDATLADQARNDEMRRLTEFGIQQNDQVKKISSWAAILFAPTLVGSIYGMNFDAMPELHWPLGYPLALAAMLATSVTLYFVFKKRSWM